MSNPTSNFNWQMPTNTDLVSQLPADFEVFGQAVDTSLADLRGGTTGQILAKNTNADMDFVWTTAAPGDITGVTAGTGISGGGASGDVTVTNSMATAIDAKGDLIAGTAADTFSRLAIGANNTVLTADSTETTGMKWAVPAAGSYTAIVAETSFGAVTGVTITSIPGTYKNLVLIINSVSFNSADKLLVRPNSSSGNQPSSTMVEGTTGETVTTSAKAQWQVNLTNLADSGTNNSWSCQFPNYASSGAKYMNFNGAYVSTASSCSIMGSAAWFNTTAITSINIKSENGNTFDSGTYALYGVN